MAVLDSKNASRRLWQQRPVTYTINHSAGRQSSRYRELDRPKLTAWTIWRNEHPSI